MGDVRFKIGQIGNDPEIADMNRWYRNEMVRRKMPNTWPESDLYHHASIYYNDEAISTLLYAPIDVHKKIYSVGAYTLPSWRRLGLYGFIWRLCVNEWRKDGIYDCFQSGYHKNNDISRIMQENQGRVVVEERGDYMRTRYPLQPTGEEFEITPDHLKPLVDLFDRLSG